MNSNKILELIITIFIGIICLFSLYNDIAAEQVIFGILLFSFLSLRSIFILFSSYSNLPFLFLSFSILYGLSGPVSALFYGGIAPIFDRPYKVDLYLIGYVYSILGILSSFLIFHVKHKDMSATIRGKEDIFIFLAIVFAVFASLSELVNIIRIGPELLFKGKAEYQSRMADLTLTLPSHIFVFCSAALFGQALRSKENKIYPVILWLSILAPYLLVLLVLGRRGALLSIIVIFVFSYFYYKAMRNVGLTKTFFLIVAFLFMGMLYGLRANIGDIIENNRYGDVIETLVSSSFWIKSLSLGKGEFGSAFGNFNTYQLYGDHEMEYGLTYLLGFTEVVPRFIWPDKPKITLYKFRDEFFPYEADRGSIASTGYSSILEAYLNFGWVGIFLMYTLYGSILIYMENKRTTMGPFYSVFYLSFIPYFISFSRNSFSVPFFWPLISVLLVYMLYVFTLNFLVRRGLP
jgi:oligosaccharide repeat unit polymerase